MTEVFGDATRGGEWAGVRLDVAGERIVAADAPGLERSLAGLTLVEAAAVGAIRLRSTPSPRRWGRSSGPSLARAGSPWQ